MRPIGRRRLHRDRTRFGKRHDLGFSYALGAFAAFDVGVITSAAMLALFGVVTLDTPSGEIVRKVEALFKAVDICDKNFTRNPSSPLPRVSDGSRGPRRQMIFDGLDARHVLRRDPKRPPLIAGLNGSVKMDHTALDPNVE